jgi:hypothetical protein
MPMIAVMDLDRLASDPATRPPAGLEANTSEAEPFDRCAAQMTVVMDEFTAAVLRNVRAGRGRNLREQGFTTTAAELEHWQHD